MGSAVATARFEAPAEEVIVLRQRERPVVGYDNEAGKGDHRHYGTREEPYQFTTPERLLADFLADMRAIRRRG